MSTQLIWTIISSKHQQPNTRLASLSSLPVPARGNCRQLSSIEKLVIIGGGYIGLEAAAVFRQLQKKVTIIEAAERILQRVACQQTADYFRERHTEQGVEFMENTKLASLTESKAGAHPLQVNLESGQQGRKSGLQPGRTGNTLRTHALVLV